MNEKFFDLKKEKQDRIMSAAMEMFAKNGYAHASTDDMVKRAHISKGLLFHYFGSKLGLYAFLYDYCVRFMQLEFSRVIPEDETDFYRLQDLMCAAWFDAVRQYPYIRLFILSGERETDADALKEIKENNLPNQIQRFLVKQNGDPYDLTALGYVLTQLTYYYRCNLFHASKPMALISFADENRLVILRILNNLLEEFLDENLPKWFDDNYIENNVKPFVRTCINSK